MELLKKQYQIGEPSFRHRAVTYAEGGVIVPDAKPDILKVLQVDATAAVSEREISDGGVTVSGIIRYNIIYIPEKEGSVLSAISAQMPFSHSMDKEKLSENTVLEVLCEVERAEFNMVNSRKLSLKAAVSVEYRAWENKEIEVSTQASDENAEVLYKTIVTSGTELVGEHSFTVRDRMEIPSGRTPIAEILKMDVDICDKEVKAITGKAVFKGNTVIAALYIDTLGEVHSVGGEIPFTELAEIFELTEDAPCSVEYRICDCGFSVGSDDDGDMRYIDFDISVTAVIHSSEECEIQLMEDCFCPGRHTDAVYDEREFLETVSAVKCTHSIKEIVSPDKKLPQISSIYNVITRANIASVTPKNGKVMIDGKIELCVLYITENSEIPIYSIKKELPLELVVDVENAEEGMECEVNINTEHISFNLNMAQEAEVRCILSAEVKLYNRLKINIISECALSDAENECAIAVYFVQPGDTLWQIAKSYAVPVSELIKYNELRDENVIMPGMRLIVPFC